MLYVNVTESAEYECRAENHHVGGQTERSQKASINLIGESNCHTHCRTPGQGRPGKLYTGDISHDSHLVALFFTGVTTMTNRF